MKGSPILATAITIVVLLGLYIGMRTLILPESSPAADSHAGHDHAAHAHSEEGHNDTALETDFELYFSSIPKSVHISQPSTHKDVLQLTELDSTEWTGSGTMSIEGHVAELQVEVEWQSPSEMNFVQIVATPARHASREKTLRSDSDVSDIAELSW